MLLCPARKVGAGGKDGPHMLWLTVGIVIGILVALAALRPRLAEVGVLRRERDKAVQQLVAPISEQLKLVDTRLERLDRDRVQSSSVLQQQLRTMVESQDR